MFQQKNAKSFPFMARQLQARPLQLEPYACAACLTTTSAHLDSVTASPPACLPPPSGDESADLLRVLHAVSLRQQPRIHVRDPRGQVGAEPRVLHDLLQGDALHGAPHQDAAQQVLALWRQVELRRDAEVQVQSPLQGTQSKASRGMGTLDADGGRRRGVVAPAAAKQSQRSAWYAQLRTVDDI